MNAKDNLCRWYTNCKFKRCFEIQSTLYCKAKNGRKISKHGHKPNGDFGGRFVNVPRGTFD